MRGAVWRVRTGKNSRPSERRSHDRTGVGLGRAFSRYGVERITVASRRAAFPAGRASSLLICLGFRFLTWEWFRRKAVKAVHDRERANFALPSRPRLCLPLLRVRDNLERVEISRGDDLRAGGRGDEQTQERSTRDHGGRAG